MEPVRNMASCVKSLHSRQSAANTLQTADCGYWRKTGRHIQGIEAWLSPLAS
jgi:hypothetical protein